MIVIDKEKCTLCKACITNCHITCMTVCDNRVTGYYDYAATASVYRNLSKWTRVSHFQRRHKYFIKE